MPKAISPPNAIACQLNQNFQPLRRNFNTKKTVRLNLKKLQLWKILRPPWIEEERAGENTYPFHCRVVGTRECKKKPLPSHAACLAPAKFLKRKHKGPHIEWSRPLVIEKIYLNDQLVTCLYETGFHFSCVVAKHLVKPEQLTLKTVELKGATQSSSNMKLPIVKVNIHSKCVTGVISAPVMRYHIYHVLLGCRYVFLGYIQHPSMWL